MFVQIMKDFSWELISMVVFLFHDYLHAVVSFSQTTENCAFSHDAPRLFNINPVSVT